MILADQCVAEDVVNALRAAGFEVVWVLDLDPGAADADVMAAAHARNALILTRDKDFGELAIVRRVPAAGVILYRLPATPVAMHAQVLIRMIGEDLSLFQGMMTVVTERGMRRRALPSPTD